MAALTDQDRQRVTNGLMRYWSQLIEQVSGVTKSDVRAAVNAADTWADDNQAAYNTALPVTFRNNATTPQKSLTLAAVVLMRYNPELLKDIFGNLD
jgi:hypothetical protein